MKRFYIYFMQKSSLGDYEASDIILARNLEHAEEIGLAEYNGYMQTFLFADYAHNEN